MQSTAQRIYRRFNAALFARNPSRSLAAGYLIYMLSGFLLLSLPIAQQKDIGWLDNLFTSVSAVSTTGLATTDPGTSYTFFGQFVILLLIQIGGLGYMTLGSLALIAMGARISPQRLRIGRSVFGLPADFNIGKLIFRISVFTFCVEGVGALLLWHQFAFAGVNNALWSAVFHSVSAFCTAGFSLFPDSFTRFQSNNTILTIISILSLLGAIGFVVIADIWRRYFQDGRPLTLTSTLVIPVVTFTLILGTFLFATMEPAIQALPPDTQLGNAFFQAMTAATTVGFNSIDTTKYASTAVIVSYVLMLIGASPSGTGGGLKTTTVGIMIAATFSALHGQSRVIIAGRQIPNLRVIQSLALGVLWGMLLAIAVLLLSLVEPHGFEKLLFEAISALATVGLSLGITGSLTPFGKSVIIALMFIGRVGVLAFFLTMAKHAQNDQNEVVREQDVMI